MNKWQVLNKTKITEVTEIVKVLLTNRGLKAKQEIDSFLDPKLSDLTIENSGIDSREVDKSTTRIKNAIKNNEQIIIFGDYDVDGICGSAILWETLNDIGAKVLPYIPHRTSEGYGLSITGIKNILIKHKDVKLIITVDNGIVANDAVDFAKQQNIDVIITDHHVPASKKPNAFSIIHTTQLCGTGVAYLFSKEFKTKNKFDHLSLAAIATVADLVPAVGGSRIILKSGLEELKITKRPGLLALIKEAAIEQGVIGVFEIGHILGPRINAMGRLELAMDSLRLLCTKDNQKAEELAMKLTDTNTKRKDITIESFESAKSKVRKQRLEKQNLIIIGDESYNPGVIGLIASRLVDEFYLPSIVLSVGQKISKASARSISGFNIIEFIRKASELLVDAGGHPMAAGFTVETKNIDKLMKKLSKLAKSLVTLEMLERTIKIDAETNAENINLEFYNEFSKLAPFGVGNPQPVFMTRNLTVSDMRMVGKSSQHILLKLISSEKKPLDAIFFNQTERVHEISIGDDIDAVYTIDKDEWRGITRFKLKIRDFRISL